MLVVVGLLLGAVSIGKDLQRNAEQQIIYSKFVQQWAVAYNEYFARTGVVLGDDQAAPTLRVNQAALDPLCGEDIFDLMDAVGIEMPPGRSEGREDRYAYLDSNGNPMQIEICFLNAPWAEDLNNRNVMVLRGLTPDLARNLDATIDGRPDAGTGLFRAASDSTQPPFNDTTIDVNIAVASVEGTIGLQPTDWQRDNRQDFAGSADNHDEDQVVVVTALYRMNQ